MDYYANRSAAITGAGSGIGRALAQRLSQAGCRLWLSDINQASLEATRDSLAHPEHCSLSRVDVADRAAVQSWAGEVAAETPHLDLLVNNAGVALMAPVRDMRYEDFHWLMDINFWGVAHGCSAFLPLLERAERAQLVNISSVFGLIGVPTQAAYNASKFAVRGYSEALRQELELSGSRVRVTCVHPGGIATDIARNARSSYPGATPDTQHQDFIRHVRTSAEDAARQILKAAQRRKPRLLLGPDARFLGLLLRLFPVSYPRLLPLLRDAMQDPVP
jgi:NAD(P)-dependent dehydrogenase (short-subunit alcohol dehydrogenase family)